jgi:hypothetical protein
MKAGFARAMRGYASSCKGRTSEMGHLLTWQSLIELVRFVP